MVYLVKVLFLFMSVFQVVQPMSNTDKIFACIRHWETIGHKNPYTTVGRGHYGAYQFSLSTWHSVGGKGNPVNASPAEQDRRAKILQKRFGWKQWQTHNLCGV